MIWVEIFENSSSERWWVYDSLLYIKPETITERAFRQLYSSRNPHWTGDASHFLCTQFIAFLLTDSFAYSWRISSAVTGMFRIESVRVLRIFFSMATLAMTVFFHRCRMVCDKPWQSIKLFEARSLPIFYFEIISWEEIPSLSEAFYSKNISSVLSRCSYLLSGSRLDRLGIGSYSSRSCEMALLWINNLVSYIWRNRICPKSVRGGNESWLPLFLIAKRLFF